jgi:hypothetical protein
VTMSGRPAEAHRLVDATGPGGKRHGRNHHPHRVHSPALRTIVSALK